EVGDGAEDALRHLLGRRERQLGAQARDLLVLLDDAHDFGADLGRIRLGTEPTTFDHLPRAFTQQLVGVDGHHRRLRVVAARRRRAVAGGTATATSSRTAEAKAPSPRTSPFQAAALTRSSAGRSTSRSS